MYTQNTQQSIPRPMGFSLIELLVVIAIITILAALLLPVISRARESAKRANCAGNLKQWGMVFHMFSDENDGEYPEEQAMPQSVKSPDVLSVYPEYLNDQRLWHCPSDQEEMDKLENSEGEYSLHLPQSKGGTMEQAGISYNYKKPPKSERNSSTVQVMHDLISSDPMQLNHGIKSVNMLFKDGHVGFVPLP